MNHKIGLIFMLSILLSLAYPNKITYAFENINNLNLTQDEIQWLDGGSNKTISVGIDNKSSIEYFNSDNSAKGYLLPLIDTINKDLKINLELKPTDRPEDNNFDLIYNKIASHNAAVSIPVIKNSYLVLTRNGSNISTLGDLDNKMVGVSSDDFVVEKLSDKYKNVFLPYNRYNSEEDAVNDLRKGIIDAFITSSKQTMYYYIHKYKDLSYSFTIDDITSNMFFSSVKNNTMLIDILDKELNHLISNGTLAKMVNKSEIDYNIMILNLSDVEKKWLNENEIATFGVAKNYLPFDYYDGKLKGIDGEILNAITNLVGIKFRYEVDDFNKLLPKMKSGEIDMLNVAKTQDRSNYIIYPAPLSTDKDVIVGKNSNEEVMDIFGLEGKKVAVVKGYWHNDFLTKNLTNVKIIETDNIQESMKLVHEGKADYLIDNPSIINYYINELRYFDLVQKGTTSTASYLYLGISKNSPELASIITKVLPLLDITKLSKKGYVEVPHENLDKSYQRLIVINVVLILVVIFIFIFSIKLIRELIKSRTEKELLKQREYLLSIDSLTELFNRNYFHSKVLPSLDSMVYPQTLIICDINNLKYVNDNYGHYYGDILIKMFADILKTAFSNKDSIFRIGGDEFIIILSSCDASKAEELIQSIASLSASKSFSTEDGRSFKVSAAIGYAVRYSSYSKYDEWFKIADMNMYNSKKDYKNTEV
ncbi:transporter substrate-binding domain-containing protein [Clostridium sp. 19966]|uniref:transporter substrate-binding domain-containing diguanylate cyclase n=1 Tax=Clostridium sp. 19966 TaxID=2768166 RepID=UPI0028DF051A|nr:transporter substrate-binding domain-containing protein [Clostridium sp. 19966]MDT8717178.1 transporter substrate-binding domain-containing protein [Clostridium sp. 19966]